MSGKEAGHYGCTERIHVAGERVLGKSQGAHGLGMLGIKGNLRVLMGWECWGSAAMRAFLKGQSRTPQLGPIPSPDRSRAGGQPGQPQLQALGTELGMGQTGMWAHRQPRAEL